MNSVEIYAKQRSNWGLLIGSLIFLFFFIYLFLNINQVNSPATAKLMSMVMFVPSFILVVFAINKLRKKQLIVLIDKKGIVFHPSQKLNYIVWGNIAEIEELKLPRQRIINIKVIDSEKYINAENQKFLQTRMKFWNQMYGAVVSFDANTLDKNHFEIMYIFDEFMDDYKTSLQTKTN